MTANDHNKVACPLFPLITQPILRPAAPHRKRHQLSMVSLWCPPELQNSHPPPSANPGYGFHINRHFHNSTDREKSNANTTAS